MPVPADYRELTNVGLGARNVEALWSFRASSAGEHLVLPDGRMDLVARYRAAGRYQVRDIELSIVGPSQKPARVPVAAGDRFLGVRFRAGWGGACFGLDAGDLRDMALTGEDADNVLGINATALRLARSEAALKTALLAASRSRDDGIAAEIAAAIDLLHLTGGRLASPELARVTGLSERTLRRRVSRVVGLSVKSLAAVLRFQRTARLLAHPSGSGLTLAQAALEGGYSDQAHMTREFQRYGGFTPGRRPDVVFGSLPLTGVADLFKRRSALAV